MDTGNWAEWTGVALQVAGATAIPAFGAAMWAIRRAMVTRQDFADWAKDHEVEHEHLEDRLAAGEVRFARVETTLEHLPTKGDVDEVRTQVGRVEGAVQALTAGVEGLTRAVGSMGDQLNILLSTHIK